MDEANERWKHPLHSPCTCQVSFSTSQGCAEAGSPRKGNWSGIAVTVKAFSVRFMPAPDLHGSWKHLWFEMFVHVCDHHPRHQLCPLVSPISRTRQVDPMWKCNLRCTWVSDGAVSFPVPPLLVCLKRLGHFNSLSWQQVTWERQATCSLPDDCPTVASSWRHPLPLKPASQ